MPQFSLTMKRAVHYLYEQRWLTIGVSLLIQALVVVLIIALLQSSPLQNGQSHVIDYVLTSMLAGIFSVMGITIFLHTRSQPIALIVYSICVCATLIFSLLNVSTYHEIAILMSVLSMLAYGLSVNFVCLLFFPGGWRKHQLYLSPYTSIYITFAAAALGLFMLLVWTQFWLATTFVIYIFPLICMVIFTWGILLGLRRLTANNQPVNSVAIIGILFVLLSLAIINGKSTLSSIKFVSSSTGFLVFYAFFIAFVALFTGMIVWGLRRLAVRALHISILAAIACIALLLTAVISTINALNIISTGLINLFTAHLFSVPMLLLPMVCCYSLIHHQLSGKASVLSRRVIRSGLWLLLAGCFVVSEITLSILEVRFWAGSLEMTLLYLTWLFLSLWLFPLVWGKVRDIGDQMFYRDFYHYNRTLSDLSTALTHMHNLDEICSFLLPHLTTLLNATETALLVRQEAPQNSAYRNTYSDWRSYYHAVSPTNTSQEQFIEQTQQAAVHFLAHPHNLLIVNNILLLPFYDSARLRGCLCLGPKLNSEPYSRQDTSFLTTLTAQLAVLEANTRYLDQVRADAQQLAALTHHVVSAQEEERRRLALELHDEVLQQAMLLVRQLSDASNMTEVATAMPLARSIVTSLRNTCLELRPPLLDELGLAEALRWLAQQQESLRKGQLHIEVQCLCEKSPRPTHEVELAFYRVAQEALSNVQKHAQASKISMRLRSSVKGDISLIIADNGHGLQREPQSESLGLAGMVERMTTIAGTLQLRTSPGRGVVIRAIYRPETKVTIDRIIERETTSI